MKRGIVVTLTVAALVTAGALAGVASCDRRPASVRVKEQLIERRFEQRALLEALYARYGHGELATAVKEGADKKHERLLVEEEAAGGGEDGKRVARELLKALGNAAVEVDQAAFEDHCRATGAGERPAVLSDKGRAFFQDLEVLSRCKQVAKLQLDIDALEVELARLRAVEGP